MIKIQIKEPYTALSRGGLKLKAGEVMDANPDDPRVAYWLNNGFAEEVHEYTKPKKPSKKKRAE